LGFTHIYGTNYRTGKFTIQRKTIGKSLTAKLKEIRAQLPKRMHTRQEVDAASGAGVFPISPHSGQFYAAASVSQDQDFVGLCFHLRL
jgi:hypothetical protein